MTATGRTGGRISYMDYWNFDEETKNELIQRLTNELPALRGAVGASQEEVANVIGTTRQTYNSVETQKRGMSWGIYLGLVFFFDYNPQSHHMLHRLQIFPKKVEECWENASPCDDVYYK